MLVVVAAALKAGAAVKATVDPVRILRIMAEVFIVVCLVVLVFGLAEDWNCEQRDGIVHLGTCMHRLNQNVLIQLYQMLCQFAMTGYSKWDSERVFMNDVIPNFVRIRWMTRLRLGLSHGASQQAPEVTRAGG